MGPWSKGKTSGLNRVIKGTTFARCAVRRDGPDLSGYENGVPTKGLSLCDRPFALYKRELLPQSRSSRDRNRTRR